MFNDEVLTAFFVCANIAKQIDNERSFLIFAGIILEDALGEDTDLTLFWYKPDFDDAGADSFPGADRSSKHFLVILGSADDQVLCIPVSLLKEEIARRAFAKAEVIGTGAEPGILHLLTTIDFDPHSLSALFSESDIELFARANIAKQIGSDQAFMARVQALLDLALGGTRNDLALFWDRLDYEEPGASSFPEAGQWSEHSLVIQGPEDHHVLYVPIPLLDEEMARRAFAQAEVIGYSAEQGILSVLSTMAFGPEYLLYVVSQHFIQSQPPFPIELRAVAEGILPSDLSSVDPLTLLEFFMQEREEEWNYIDQYWAEVNLAEEIYTQNLRSIGGPLGEAWFAVCQAYGGIWAAGRDVLEEGGKERVWAAQAACRAARNEYFTVRSAATPAETRAFDLQRRRLRRARRTALKAAEAKRERANAVRQVELERVLDWYRCVTAEGAPSAASEEY